MPYKDPEKQRIAQRAAAQRHYAKNTEVMKARAVAHTKKTRQANRAYIREFKARPCTDCGVQYPYYVMQLDHLDPKTKRFNFGRIPELTFEKMLEELAKCEVVCANCHAERSHQQREAKRCARR